MVLSISLQVFEEAEENLDKIREMETQRIMELPHNMDKRPRKRPRLTWDIPPPAPPPKVPLSSTFSLSVSSLTIIRIMLQIAKLQFRI